MGALLQGCEYFLPGNIEMEQYVSYSSDYEGDRLILTGYVTMGHGVYAEVTHSVRPEDKNAADTICDAIVTLLEDGRQVATLHANTERRLTLNYAERFLFYLLPDEVELHEGREYSLRAESPTRGAVESAPDRMPGKVNITEVWADTSHWGRYESFHASYDGAQDGMRTYGFMRSYRHDACHTRSQLTSLREAAKPHDGSGIISVDNSGFNMYTDSVSVEVVTLSEETLRYLKSLDDYGDSKDDDAYEYPLPVYENVEGGYGFVGTYAVSAKTLMPNERNSVFEDSEWYDDPDTRIDISYYIPVEMALKQHMRQ